MSESPKIFFNGKIYNSLDPQNVVWGFSVVNGRIHNIYSTYCILPTDAELYDLQGGVILPGFTDSHIHLLMLAETFAEADLSFAKSEEAAVRILKDWTLTQNLKPGVWIKGRGWSFNDWQPAKLPSRSSLDRAFPENPVVLSSKCGHLLWVNSQALEAAGLKAANRHTLEKWGKRIEYFPNGSLSGVFKEDAEELIFNQIPERTEEEKLNLLQQTIVYLNQLGIFAIHNMESFESLELLTKLISKSPDFFLRVTYFITTDDFALLDKTAAEIHNDKRFSEFISIAGIKLFVDGSLGGRTAWLFSPYEGEPENYGICTISESELERLVYAANKRNLVAAVHAIGDRAIFTTLRIFQIVAEKLNSAHLPLIRNRIEHFQLVNPEILKMTRKIKPVLSMQPLHLAGDWRAADKHWGKRSRFAYAFKSVLESNAPLIFGSDAPVESPNPWWGIFSAVNRQDLDGSPSSGWFPQEKISLAEAINCYTAKPASVSKFKATGALQKDCFADFIVLDMDPFNVTSAELKSIKVIGAHFKGERLFGEI